MAELPSVPRLNYDREEAAAALGVSLHTLDEWMQDATFPVWRDGRLVKIPVALLDEWNRNRTLHQVAQRAAAVAHIDGRRRQRANPDQRRRLGGRPG